MAKHEKQCNAQLSFIYFSVNVSVLAVLLFRRQLSKKLTISDKIVDFFNLLAKYNSW